MIRGLAALLVLSGCASVDTRCGSVAGRVLGPYGPLWSAFVYVKSGLEGRRFDPPAEPVVLDQRDYQFVPHVFGVRVGQTCRIKSSDHGTHNVNCVAFNNDTFNLMMTADTPIERVFKAPEVMIAFRCNLHPNMTAYAGILDHPYFAVTGPDGRFELKGLPPGEYVIGAWAEERGIKEARLRVLPDRKESVTFSY